MQATFFLLASKQAGFHQIISALIVDYVACTTSGYCYGGCSFVTRTLSRSTCMSIWVELLIHRHTQSIPLDAQIAVYKLLDCMWLPAWWDQGILWNFPLIYTSWVRASTYLTQMLQKLVTWQERRQIQSVETVFALLDCFCLVSVLQHPRSQKNRHRIITHVDSAQWCQFILLPHIFHIFHWIT